MSVDSNEKINMVNEDDKPCNIFVSKVINLFRELLSNKSTMEKKLIKDNNTFITTSVAPVEREGRLSSKEQA